MILKIIALRSRQNVHRIILKCTKAKSTALSKAASNTFTGSNVDPKKKVDSSKFELYFNYQADIKTIKPHQTLAINRGEKHKFLTVKVETSDFLKKDLLRFIFEQYMSEGLQYPLRREVFNRSLEECFTKKCKNS